MNTRSETIPVVDLGPYLAGEPGAMERVARELRFALTEIGFYFIVNHGVPETLIRDAFHQAARFHGQPLEKKMVVKTTRAIRCSHGRIWTYMRPPEGGTGDSLRNLPAPPRSRG